MSNECTSTLEKQFKEMCNIINLKYEYPKRALMNGWTSWISRRQKVNCAIEKIAHFTKVPLMSMI